MRSSNLISGSPSGITLEGISKHFDTKTEHIAALQNVSLTILQGDSLAVSGTRKSGKTTLLQILAGILPPDRGRCLFGTLDYYSQLHEDRRLFRKTQIGWLPKNTPLLPNLTLEENIRLPLSYLHIDDADIECRLRERMENYGLYGKRHLYPKEASAKHCRLTAFFQAAILRPAVLLADDIESEDLFSLLKAYRAENNATLIFSTANHQFIEQSDTALRLNDGAVESIQRM